MPNLENWLSCFKNNEDNARNEVYYDIDYNIVGVIQEKLKYMYPNDQSLIAQRKV